MNTVRDHDAVIGAWLDDGPLTLPAETRQAIIVGIRAVTRRRAGIAWPFGRVGLPTFDLRRLSMALGGATVVVVAAAVALNALPNLPGIGGPATTAPTVSPEATATATAPSATAAPPTSEPPTSANPDVFAEIAPGEFVDIPDWPLGERTTPPRVWTGTELIVWGDGIYGRAGDGAAFDLAAGTWRVIAEAPLSPRAEPAVAWTGTEMIVWGGRVENTFDYDGAAYNPVTDTWRLLPSAPAFFGKDPSMIWIGDEAVILGAAGNADTTGEYIAAAAYDPVTDGWRALADAPASVRVDDGKVWWTGESIIAANVGSGGPTEPSVGRMARYDVAADSWTVVEIGSSSAVVGVTGADGRVNTFINMPSETGVRAQLIDSTGNLLAELPAFPGDPGVFGDRILASGLWVGDEALFEIWADEPDSQPEQIWALNASTQTWRRLDADTTFPRIDASALAVGDLLLMSNRPTDEYRGTPRACCVAPPSRGGSIYRVGTAGPSEVQ